MLAVASSPVEGLGAAVGTLAAEPLDGLASRNLGDDLRAIRRCIDLLEAEACRRLERFIAMRGHEDDHAASPVTWLANECGLSKEAAHTRVQMTRALRDLPRTEQALRTGDISFGNAAVITRAHSEVGADAVREVETDLLEAARSLGPSRLRLVTRHLRHIVDPDGSLRDHNRQHENRRVDLSQTLDGTFYLEGHFPADTGAILKAAITSLIQPIPGDQRNPGQKRADAVIEMATRQLQAGNLPSAHGVRPHVTLTVSDATLRGEPGAPLAELRGAGPVIAEVARRLTCDATLTTMTVDRHGKVLSIGRTARTVPATMRRALIARDGGCGYPGCDRPPEWTDAHHRRHWADGGETRIDNLVLLCRFHHRVVHEGGERLVTDSGPSPPA